MYQKCMSLNMRCVRLGRTGVVTVWSPSTTVLAVVGFTYRFAPAKLFRSDIEFCVLEALKIPRKMHPPRPMYPLT